MRRKLLCIIFVVFLPTVVQAALITVGSERCDYISIQEAIDVANSGDTILVANNTYYECLNIDKPIILKGVDTPKIDLDLFFVKFSGSLSYSLIGNCDPSNGVILSSDGIILEDFEIANSTNNAITLKSNNCTIKDCYLNADPKYAHCGIYIDSNSDFNLIMDNYGQDDNGIYIGSSNNVIINNTVPNIQISSLDNILLNNTVESIGIGGDNNTIKNNTIGKTDIRNSDYNIVSGNKIEVVKINMRSSNNIIKSNQISSKILVSGSRNVIENNMIDSFNLFGCLNVIKENEIGSQGISIYIGIDSFDNVIESNIINGSIEDKRAGRGYPSKNSLKNNVDPDGFSIGDTNYVLEDLTTESPILINEIAWSERKIELYSKGRDNLDIGGWDIWNAPIGYGVTYGVQIEEGTILTPGEHIIISVPGLYDSGAIKLENTYHIERDYVAYEEALEHIGESYQRMPDGSSNWAWATPSLERANAIS
jgi:hypothetical protein